MRSCVSKRVELRSSRLELRVTHPPNTVFLIFLRFIFFSFFFLFFLCNDFYREV